MVMLVAGPDAPALMAILSSPQRMYEYRMLTFVDDDGSMPSVLRAVFGLSIFTPQAVNPSVLLTITWKFGELRRVMRYRVKLFDSSATMMRGTFCLALSTLAFCARSHHVTFWPARLAPPRPSITP